MFANWHIFCFLIRSGPEGTWYRRRINGATRIPPADAMCPSGFGVGGGCCFWGTLLPDALASVLSMSFYAGLLPSMR